MNHQQKPSCFSLLTHPYAIQALGMLYIFTSLSQMYTLTMRKEWYLEVYAYMPIWLAYTRYAFSWAQRIIGITGGIGLILRRSFGHWIILGINVFTILTVYWKHPYTGFLRHAQALDIQYPLFFQQYPFLSFASLARWSMIGHILFDIVFCSAVIYFLTRPAVKQHFR